MIRSGLLALLATLTVATASVVGSPAANAWARHTHANYHRHHARRHHHMQRTASYYHREVIQQEVAQQYGTYPNMQFFQRDGHIYMRNRETGDVFLAKW